jgi:hypothetical protein
MKDLSTNLTLHLNTVTVDTNKIFTNDQILKAHMHSPRSDEPDFSTAVQFDSDFEGGNLSCAVKISHGLYHLYMQPDSNSMGH